MLVTMSDFSFPLSLVVQFLIFASLTLIVLMPLYLAYIWAVQRNRSRTDRSHLLVITAFVVGFFLGGALGWIMLRPEIWKLSFVGTIRAALDLGHSYGQQTAQGAEFLLQWMAVFAIVGGLLSAAAAYLGIRRGTPAWDEWDE